MSASHYTKSSQQNSSPINSIYTPAILSGCVLNNCPVSVANNVATATVLAQALVGGVLSNIGTTATAVTTDSATAIYSYLISQGIIPSFATVGSVVFGTAFDFKITNASSATATLTAGSGVLIQGTATVLTNASRIFKFVFNSATSVTIYC
jgi:hypothetical protein